MAKRIDPQTCDFFKMHTEQIDPYGIFNVPDEWSCIGNSRFVRNLPDGDWVWMGDLPDDIHKALMERAEREREPKHDARHGQRQR